MQPNPTLYIQNLDTKISKDGEPASYPSCRRKCTSLLLFLSTLLASGN